MLNFYTVPAGSISVKLEIGKAHTALSAGSMPKAFLRVAAGKMYVLVS